MNGPFRRPGDWRPGQRRRSPRPRRLRSFPLTRRAGIPWRERERPRRWFLAAPPQREAEFINAAGVAIGRPAAGGIETADHGLLLRDQHADAGRHSQVSVPTFTDD